MAKMITILLVLFICSCMIIPFTNAATFNIINQCTYTVWAAAVPGGGKPLGRGQSWEINVPPGTIRARIWGRTKCKFDANGKGGCETGDCGGILECKMYGKPPNTLAEFAVNQTYKKDYIDISNVDGFNIPMEFRSVTPCRNIQCKGPNIKQCPLALRTAGGCNNPCTVYKTIKYCCSKERGSCGPTPLSRVFKEKCPDAYSYPQDDQTSQFTCNSGTNYKVVFCP